LLYICSEYNNVIITFMKKTNNISEFLLENNIKPSYQRLKIFEYLYVHKTHPTVDEIYKALKGEIPTLSKTTVYNTLKLFIDKGVVIIINIEDNETRYDADTSLHGHFKCEICGNIYDFDVNDDGLTIDLKNYKIKETHIYIKGICEKCMN